MDEQLVQTLEQHRLLLRTEETVQRRANQFYRHGFTPENITPSQLAAVSVLISRARSFQDARKSVCDFLDNQLEKLRKEAEKTGKKERSWFKAPTIGADREERSLGGLLEDWLRDCSFLPKELAGQEMELAALSRFWAAVNVFHTYERTTGAGMPIDEEKL